MQDSIDPDVEAEADKQGIAALLTQLGTDAGDFARAEMRYFRAQASERASIAIPALFMFGASAVLMLAVVVAIMVTVIILITPFVGQAIAMLIVITVAALAAFLLYRAGRARMSQVFRKLEG